MPNINLKSLRVLGGDEQSGGAEVTVEAVVNNRETLPPGPLNSDGCYSGNASGVGGHKADVTLEVVSDSGTVDTYEERVCAPIEGTAQDPIVETDFGPLEPGSYDIVGTVSPTTGTDDRAAVSIVVEEVGDQPGGSDGNDDNEDGGDSNGGDDGDSIFPDDDDDKSNTTLQTIIKNPVGAGVAFVGGTLVLSKVIEQAAGDEE